MTDHIDTETELRRCPSCNGRGYLTCECWPGDCICGYGDETCEECNGEGVIDPSYDDLDDADWDTNHGGAQTAENRPKSQRAQAEGAVPKRYRLPDIDTAAIREVLKGFRSHTPGPWEWWTSNSWRRLKRSHRYPDAILTPFANPSDGHPDCEVSGPDMRLISAAPYLSMTVADLCDALDANDAEIERLRGVLTTIAQQKKSSELTTGRVEYADFEDSHDSIVGLARDAMAAMEVMEW